MRRPVLPMPALLIPIALAACQHQGLHTGGAAAPGRVAVAALVGTTGRPAGHATVTELRDGLRVTIDATGLTPGPHGVHLHAVGRCDAPTFAGAGPHWNPTDAQHGAMNPRGPHAGDLPNLIAGPDGRGTLGVVLAGARFDDLLDADGAAVVIHVGQDDVVTDPAGNSGGRVVCGVLVAG